jgi:hypothetical protein
MTPAEENLFQNLTPGSAPARAQLDTSQWFDRAHATSEESPIDEYFANLTGINRLYLQAQNRGDYSSVLGSLVYMGMVSAAEGYFRSLLRRLILIDPACRENASSRSVSYGAALHHEKNLLPEALLEQYSFASAKTVAAELKGLCNISQMSKDGAVPRLLQGLFDDFESICQVRHCGIHRFGKLGSQQALRLGIDLHKPLLEKPLKLSVQNLQEIAEALEALVCAVNSYCFADLLKRTHTASPAGRETPKRYAVSWTAVWASDRRRFKKYYDIFASKRSAQPSPPMKFVFSAFQSFIADHNQRR